METLVDLVECVPNFSEGRDRSVVEILCAAASSVKGVALLDVHSDPVHHRSVLTLAGNGPSVVEAAFRATREACSIIDLNHHRGAHPRIGAADVIPFVPVGSTPMEACVELARSLGRRIGSELGIPVYLYGAAATRSQRQLLANIRRGQYEALRKELGSNPARDPDFGPSVVGPAGAVAVGARKPLVALNVNIMAPDTSVARAVAADVRESGGGLKGVMALGLPTNRPGVAQVSMNLTDPEATSIMTAYQRVKEEVERRGAKVVGAEIVGLVFASALARAVAEVLPVPALTAQKVLERRILTDLDLS